MVRHFLEATIKKEDRKDKEKIKRSKSSFLFSLVHPQVLKVKEPDPVAEDGGNAEDKEEDERRSFPRH